MKAVRTAWLRAAAEATRGGACWRAKTVCARGALYKMNCSVRGSWRRCG